MANTVQTQLWVKIKKQSLGLADGKSALNNLSFLMEAGTEIGLSGSSVVVKVNSVVPVVEENRRD